MKGPPNWRVVHDFWSRSKWVNVIMGSSLWVQQTPWLLRSIKFWWLMAVENQKGACTWHVLIDLKQSRIFEILSFPIIKGGAFTSFYSSHAFFSCLSLCYLLFLKPPTSSSPSLSSLICFPHQASFQVILSHLRPSPSSTFSFSGWFLPSSLVFFFFVLHYHDRLWGFQKWKVIEWGEGSWKGRVEEP